MKAKKLRSTFVIALFLVLIFSFETTGAAEYQVQGRVWYDSQEDSDWSMDLELVDGVAVPKEMQYGERVRVLLVGEPLDHEGFMGVMAETGNSALVITKLKIEKSVSFDLCRNSDGSGIEICGIAIHGPGLFLSESGFGAYDHFTKEVSYEDDRVKAKLKTGKPEQQNSIAYGFDLSFDLPISTYEKK